MLHQRGWAGHWMAEPDGDLGHVSSFWVPDWGQKQSKDLTCPPLCFVPAASLVPHRKSDFASVVLRALLTGICVSMLNSCLAGRSLGRTGKELNTPRNAGAGVGRLGATPTALTGPPNPLLSPPCGSFSGSPKSHGAAGAPHPHLGCSWDISRVDFEAL